MKKVLNKNTFFQYGLYSAFIPGFVYFFLGTAKDVTIGPVALLAILTAPLAEKDPAFAVFLAFTSGIIIAACGLLRLGEVV